MTKKVRAEKIVHVQGLKLPDIKWVGPNKDHPYEGYAIYSDGEHAATATISVLEWGRMDRSRIEVELKAYVAKYPEQCKVHLDELLRMAKEMGN